MIKKTTALFLCLIMFFSFLQINVFAKSEEEAWASYFEEYSKTKGNVLMSPGSDDSQRNFSWYSPRGSKSCKVVVSENKDMSDSKEFKGKTTLTPEGDCVNKVTISQLNEGTTYYYKCITSKSESNVASFNTLDGKDFTAMYVTDIHITYNEDDMENPLEQESYNFHKVLKKATEKSNIDLVVSSGDQGSYGLRSEYTALMASPLWSSIPFAPCAGNHDRKGFDFRFFTNNPNRYKKGVYEYIAEDYWYVKGDVLFLVFNSNCCAAATHRKFAKEAVAKNPDVKWRVAYLHHDMYGIMSDNRLEYSEEYLQPIFGEIFDEYGFDLVLTGHTHQYSITNAVFDSQATDSIVGKDSITNPKGTIYMVSGSINHPRGEENTKGDHFDENLLGYYHLSHSIVYNLIDFSEDSIKINSYTTDEDSPFHSFTINKTTQKGGHPDFTADKGRVFVDAGMDIGSFFKELGIRIKLLFNLIDILNKQK